MRNDVLVSVGIVDSGGPASTIPRLVELGSRLAERFCYYEILYVIPESLRDELDAFASTLAAAGNIRVLITGDGTNIYRQRLLAAKEAIGDVVCLVDPEEMPVEDVPAHAADAFDRNRILIGWLPARGLTALTYPLVGLLSRNEVTARASHTVILPREQLGPILARRSAALDLRFEPRRKLHRYEPIPLVRRTGRGTRAAQRGELFLEILLSGVPRFLKAYAALGLLVSLGALAYGAYAVLVLLLRSHVQEGWFSNAVILAGSTGFMAGGLSIIAVALLSVYERLGAEDDRAFIDEIANTGFFRQAVERNVAIGCEADD